MYRCWLFSCSKDIPNGEEVWLDASGDVVNWAYPNRPTDPAPYHPACVEERRRQVAVAVGTRTVEEPSQAPRSGEQLDLF